VLSTMLSMGQVQLMVAEAGRIIEDHDDARRIQALCYLALVYASIGQHEAFTDQVVRSLIPEAMESEQVPRGSADRLVKYYANAALDPPNLRALSVGSKRQFGDLLARQSAATGISDPQRAMLERSAAAFYREAAATDAEADLLRTVVER
ncbi:MAG: hypothetical protein OES38_22175, partial [Gammaproteobacteria bacterium]|nr:hypothetical protein [Gammaproteobacteria bacterium]